MTTVRQKAESNWGDAATITPPSGAAAEGNLLVIFVSERSGGTATNHTVSGSSGWTQGFARTIEQSNSTYRRTISGFYKVAGASEPTSYTIDDGTSNSKRGSFIELVLDGSETGFTFLGAASNDNGQVSDAETLSSGTTSSFSSGQMVGIAALVVKLTAGPGTNRTFDWDNGYSREFTGAVAANNMQHNISVDYVDTVTGTKESTATDDNTGDSDANVGLSAGIMIFETIAAAGGSNPKGPLGIPLKGPFGGPI